MSLFYIGQPIKKARGCAIGVTATVTAVGVPNLLRPEATMWVRVHAPCIGVAGFRFASGDEAAANPDEWEPIIPDGLESIEEINQLYEPQEVTQT